MRVEHRFRGPDDSGNGGYSCGLFAKAIDAPVAQVSLLQPIPLKSEIQIVQPAETKPGDGQPDALALGEGRTPIAEIRAAEPMADLHPPLIPSLAAARSAGADSPFLAPDRDFFTSCFVCGPKNEAGLGLYVGAIPGTEPPLFADTFSVPTDLADAEGNARPEIIWAALDCPSCLPSFWGETPAVLASLTAEIHGPVPTGTERGAVAWEISREGRKLHSASALFDADGQILARARALWIRLRPTS